MTIIQTLPEEAKAATVEDFFNRVNDTTLIRSNVEYYEDTIAGYVLKTTNSETNGERLLKLVKTNNIFIVPI